MAWPLLLFAALALLPSAAARPSAPATNSSSRPLTNITLGVVVPERDLRSLLGPALELALEALEPQLSRAALCVRPVIASYRDCSVADEKSETLKAAHSPDVLLGLGCDSEDDDVGRRASDWGLPLVTAGHYYRDPEFKTMVYAGPAGSTLAVFLTLLHRRFNWTSRAAFALSRAAENSHPDHSLLRIRKRLLDAPKFIGARKKYRRPDDAVRFIRAHGRVVYIYGPLELFQQMMRLAQAQDMTNGDYVFIYLDFLGESLEAAGHRKAAKPWQSKESLGSGGLREAFQTVLIITFHQPQTPKYQRFQSKLILRAQRDFGVALNDSQYKNLVAGCFHDGLLLYIRALIETLRDGGSKQNTSRILKKMRTLKIQGVTGTVSIGKFNERETYFDLWSMANMESGQYQVVGSYMGTVKQIKWLGPIHWKQGSPPFSNPPCVVSMDDPSCDKGECIEGLMNLLSWARPCWSFLSPFTPALLPPVVAPVCQVVVATELSLQLGCS